jgi:hypothetical protein
MCLRVVRKLHLSRHRLYSLEMLLSHLRIRCEWRACYHDLRSDHLVNEFWGCGVSVDNRLLPPTRLRIAQTSIVWLVGKYAL